MTSSVFPRFCVGSSSSLSRSLRFRAPFCVRVALCFGLLLVGSFASAQSTLTISSASALQGSSVVVETTLTNENNIVGWSWGVCQDSTSVLATGVDMGLEVLSLRGGLGPEFHVVDLLGGQGWTVGSVVAFDLDSVLPAASNRVMEVVSYDLLGPATVALCFCDTLAPGAFPVVTQLVLDGNGTAEFPTATCGEIGVAERFTYRLVSTTLSFDAGSGVGSTQVSLEIEESQNSATFPTLINGVQFGVTHDAALLVVTDVTLAGEIAALNGGSGPAFFNPQLLSEGVTVSTLFGFGGTAALLSFPNPTVVANMTYETVAAAFQGGTGGSTLLQFTDDLGSPVVPTFVVRTDGGAELAVEVPGVVEFVPTVGVEFIRGDFDASLDLGLFDATQTLAFLFSNGIAPSCEDAMDFNDDGNLNLIDPVGLLQFLFAGGAAPMAPFPDCGIDPTVDTVGCALPGC